MSKVYVIAAYLCPVTLVLSDNLRHTISIFQWIAIGFTQSYDLVSETELSSC